MFKVCVYINIYIETQILLLFEYYTITITTTTTTGNTVRIYLHRRIFCYASEKEQHICVHKYRVYVDVLWEY